MPKEVFAGRRELLRRFRESLLALESETRESKGPKPKKQKDSPAVCPQLFVICGESGSGKSALVRRFVSVAGEVELEAKKGLRTAVLDFEDPIFTRNILAFTPRMLVQYVHAVLSGPALGMEDSFSEYTSVDRRLDHVIAKVSALRRDEWLKETDNNEAVDLTNEPAQKAASRTADAVNSAPPHARTARQEAEAAFLRWLREEKRFPEEECDLFENADYRLTKALVNGLVTLSAEHPLLLAIDNLDRVANPLVLQWLRSVFFGRLFDRKNRVVAVVSSRDALLRSYRNEFPEEILHAVSLDDYPLCRLDIDECNQSLHLGLSAEAIDAVEEATCGIPLAVRDVVAYAEHGAVSADILEAVAKAPTANDKMATIVTRFCAGPGDARSKARVMHLAMLGQADPKILAALWNVPVSDIGAEIVQLAEKYCFIDGKAMHNGVSGLFRKYLIGQSAGASGPHAGIVREFGETSFAQYNEQRTQLATALPAPEKRFVDERYETALLGCVEGLLWHNQAELKRALPGFFCECLLYNQVLGGRILAAVLEFSGVLQPDLAALFNTLCSGFLAAEGQPLWTGEKPAPAELAMLSALTGASGALAPLQQAILRLRSAGSAYRRQDYPAALDELKKCEPYVDESDLFRDSVFDGYCEVGSAFCSAQLYDMAIKAFGRAAEIRPDSHDAWYNLGSSYGALKRHAQAEDSFAKAAACKPDSFDTFAALGAEQFALKKYGDAVGSYGKAVALNQGSAETWHMLGLSHAALASHADAVEAYKKAVALFAGDADCRFDMAVSQAGAGNAADAIDSCKKALELNPAHQKAAELLGDQLFSGGKFSEAAQAFEAAARLGPKDETVWYRLGCSRLEAGETNAAVEAFTKATDLKKDFADAYNKAGLAFARAKDFEAAIAAYGRAVQADPAHFEAYNNLGDAYGALKEPEKALAAYTKSAGARPEFSTAWYNMGLVCHELGRDADALEPFSKAASLSPDKPELWLAKGLSLSGLDRYEDAAECFTKATTLSPRSFDAWYNRGLALARAGKHGDAVAAFVKASDCSPGSEDVWYRLGQSYAAQGRHDPAIASFAKAVAINPLAGETWHLLGVSNQEDNRFAEAVTAFREAVKLFPDKQESWHRAGLCSYYQNKHDDAIELLSKAKDLAPDNKDTVYTLGLSYHAKGNYGEAAKLYSRTLELAPDMANAGTNLALSLHALGRYEEAVAEYRKIVEAQPANGEVWFNMGLALEAQAQGEEAVAAYAKAAEIAPEKRAAWINMGTLQISLERYADAIASFTKVVEAESGNADVWANIGLASYYCGRYDGAAAAYAKVNELRPGDAMSWGGLGLTYYTMGNYAKAIEASEKALAIKPDELWIQVNLALAAILALDLDKARSAFETIIALAKQPSDLMHAIASLKELVARNPNLSPAREILAKLEDAWRKLKK